MRQTIIFAILKICHVYVARVVYAKHVSTDNITDHAMYQTKDLNSINLYLYLKLR